jgi:hypothetical protein
LEPRKFYHLLTCGDDQIAVGRAEFHRIARARRVGCSSPFPKAARRTSAIAITCIQISSLAAF